MERREGGAKMRFLAVLIGMCLMVGVATSADVEYVKDVDNGDGYFTGTFYKDAGTNEIFKVIRETSDTIYLEGFESGEVVLQGN